MKRQLIYILILSCIPNLGIAQSEAIPIPSLSIQKTSGDIQLDGRIDESAWSDATIATDFWVQAPVDDRRAIKKTEVRVLYDERNIYVSAVCWDDDDYVIQTLKRDGFGSSDDFAVLFDPVGQKTTGYGFGVNAMGAQTEALLISSEGGDAAGNDESWDNKWFSAVSREADRWTVEMAIPFKSLRYKDAKAQWAINFIRIDPGANETHVWSRVPRQFNGTEMAFFGQLNWDQAPKKLGGNVSLIPYATTRMDQADGKTELNGSIGGDAKIAITPTLNLDVTVNPDFSQVEVDRQVTNLTRFSIFFPERRQFFLENADVLNAFGQFADRPFYSRRIGLTPNGSTVPILYGMRISGNLTNKLRVGALNMHSRSGENQAAQNYSALSFQHRLGKRSAIKGIFLNRQAFTDTDVNKGDYGRNAGGELVLSNASGRWQGSLGFLNSMKAGYSKKNNMVYGLVDYNGKNFRGFLGLKTIQENYFVDMGFNGRINNFNPTDGTFTRIGFTQLSSMLNYYIYPKESKKVNYHWSGIENFAYFNTNGTVNEWYTRLRHFIFFQNTSQLRFRLNNNYVDLIFPFALTSPALPATSYNMSEFNIQFNTDRRKKLGLELFTVYGQFFNGNKWTSDVSLNYRVQPWGNFSLGIERNDIWFPEPFEDVTITLATAQVEVNFATNLFWTTFFQYNTQSERFNINSRLQWRYAPMSDVFLVYTDNYEVAGMFGPKSRSLVLKVNYWLTI